MPRGRSVRCSGSAIVVDLPVPSRISRMIPLEVNIASLTIPVVGAVQQSQAKKIGRELAVLPEKAE